MITSVLVRRVGLVDLRLQQIKWLSLLLCQHGIERIRVLLGGREELLGDDKWDLVDEWVVRQQLSFLIDLLDALVERGLVGNGKLLTRLHFGLDLAFKLPEVEHHLIYLECPHGETLSLEVQPVLGWLPRNSFFAPLVRHLLPTLEEALHPVAVNRVACVGSDSLLLALAFEVLFPCL